MIWPSNGGKPLELLTMITAAAPACWPKIAFATRAHVPRATTMTLPVTSPAAWSSALLQPRLIESVSPRDTSCAVAGITASGYVGSGPSRRSR